MGTLPLTVGVRVSDYAGRDASEESKRQNEKRRRYGISRANTNKIKQVMLVLTMKSGERTGTDLNGGTKHPFPGTKAITDAKLASEPGNTHRIGGHVPHEIPAAGFTDSTHSADSIVEAGTSR